MNTPVPIPLHFAPSGKVTKWGVQDTEQVFRTKKAAQEYIDRVCGDFQFDPPAEVESAPAPEDIEAAAQRSIERKPKKPRLGVGQKGARRTSFTVKGDYVVSDGVDRMTALILEHVGGEVGLPLNRRDLSEEDANLFGRALLNERFEHGASWSDYRLVGSYVVRGLEGWAYREIFVGNEGEFTN